MNIKKNFLSRMTRRKSSTPAEPEEGAFEIPPPSAIGRMPSDSSPRAESMESGYGLDLELLASDEPPRPDSANGMNAQESGHAPALESSPAPISDESPDAPKPPREAAPFEEYGLDLELLTEPESDESPDESEPPQEDDESASSMVESAVEAPASEPEAIGDSAPEHEEAASAMAESAVEVAASGPEIPQESEPEAVADPPREEPEEPSETPLTESGFYPLVRNARGDWRPGKGFSRSELREAGLNLTDAARLRIRVDKRRRNAHPMNVVTLEKAKNGA